MSGDEFRAAVLERWRLSEPEVVLLDAAAGTLDLVAEIEQSGMALPERARELRAQRLTFARLIGALALPDVQGRTVGSATQARARKAAEARWAGPGGRRGAAA